MRRPLAIRSPYTLDAPWGAVQLRLPAGTEPQNFDTRNGV